jgi:hypothetical protein
MSVVPRLGCPYPRCPSHSGAGSPQFDRAAPEFESATTRPDGHDGIRACRSCGRPTVACPTNSCRKVGASNRSFVRFCRRCKLDLLDTSYFDLPGAWERERTDGWDLAPSAIGASEVVADLSSLIERSEPHSYSIALAMVRGVLAIHHAGQYLALIRADAAPAGDEYLWEEPKDPFPRSPNRFATAPAPHTPTLLSDERHLLFSCSQGVMALDLWGCHGLSAKDNSHRHRIIRLNRRSIVVPPIPIDEHRIGLVSQGWSRPGDPLPKYRWTIWDLSRGREHDDELSALLDSEEAVELPILGPKIRCEMVDGRVIALATTKEQWVWKLGHAAASEVDGLRRTSPDNRSGSEASIDLPGDDFQGTNDGIGHSFLVSRPGGGRGGRLPVRKFSWYYNVLRGNVPSTEYYEVDFETLDAERPQALSLASGAEPIGPALDDNDLPKMFFRAGMSTCSHLDGPAVGQSRGGLPSTIHSVRLAGPVAVIVGRNDHGKRYILLTSLRHQSADASVTVEGELLSYHPLLWSRWLYTVERDPGGRLFVYRRPVRFVAPSPQGGPAGRATESSGASQPRSARR